MHIACRQVNVTVNSPRTDSQQYALADVVEQVPRLLDFLLPHDWSTVCSTNRQLRQWFHGHVKAVSIDSHEDLEFLAKGFWPQLTMVLVNGNRDTFSLESKVNGTLQMLAAINMGGNTWAIIVKPRLEEASAAGSSSAADQHRMSPASLSRLESLDLGSPRGDVTILCFDLDAPRIAQLATINWPSLSILHVEANDLGAVKVGLLLDNWRGLVFVALRGSGCSTKCMRELVQASWLQYLDLNNSGIDTQAVAALANGQWPALKHLGLDRNDLCAESIAALATASFPLLKRLDLNCNSLDSAAAKQLSRGNWSKLARIALSDNNLDDEALFHLRKGQWPCLEKLLVSQNMITATGCVFLTQGAWPKLNHLELDSRGVCVETWSVLSLDPRKLQEAAELKYSEGVGLKVGMSNIVWVCRVNAMATGIWPALQEVAFVAVDLRSTLLRRKLTATPFHY